MFKNKNTVKSLQDESSAITDVFTKTVNDLLAVNQKIEAESTKKEAEKAQLEADLAALNEQMVKNQNVIGKIKAIFTF